MNMWEILTLALVCLASRCVCADDVISQRCHNTSTGREKCLTLYATLPAEPVSWDDAATRCVPGGALVSMTTESTRRAAQGLVRDARVGEDGWVWTSGRRAGDRTWKYLHSQTFTGTLTGELRTQRYCGKFEFGRSGPISDSCTRRDNHQALCQYTPSAGQGCLFVDLLMYGQCFHMSSESMDWFEAWNYCRAYNTDSTLSAYILGGEQEFEDFVLDTSRGRQETDRMYFWLALTRYPWQWHTRSGVTPMDYYNFDANEGSDNLRESCLTLRSRGGAVGWDDRECSDLYQHYICEYESVVPTRAAGNTPTTSAEIDSVTEAASSNTTVETVQNTGMASTTMYIIIAVCVVVVLVSVAIVVGLFIKGKQKPKEQKVNKFAHLSDRNITKQDITIVHGLPDDIPDLTTPPSPSGDSDPGYFSVNNGVTPARSIGLEMDDPYAEIPGSAPPSEWDDYPDGDDFPPYSEPHDVVDDGASTCNEYSNLPKVRGEIPDKQHFLSELGEIYALPRKSVTSMSDVIVDNPAYTTKEMEDI